MRNSQRTTSIKGQKSFLGCGMWHSDAATARPRPDVRLLARLTCIWLSAREGGQGGTQTCCGVEAERREEEEEKDRKGIQEALTVTVYEDQTWKKEIRNVAIFNFLNLLTKRAASRQAFSPLPALTKSITHSQRYTRVHKACMQLCSWLPPSRFPPSLSLPARLFNLDYAPSAWGCRRFLCRLYTLMSGAVMAFLIFTTPL